MAVRIVVVFKNNQGQLKLQTDGSADAEYIRDMSGTVLKEVKHDISASFEFQDRYGVNYAVDANEVLYITSEDV